jgi:hypothetical protein
MNTRGQALVCATEPPRCNQVGKVDVFELTGSFAKGHALHRCRKKEGHEGPHRCWDCGKEWA